MGVPKLASFISQNFTGWKRTDFSKWTHVIIDGNNFYLQLYKISFPWVLGGEYEQFGAEVEKFFTKSGFKNPIVVFDHGPRKNLTDEVVCKHRKDSLKVIERLQSQNEWDLNHVNGRGNSIAPVLVTATFYSILRKLKIEIVFADGEADGKIAALANQYECPVISSDSDFFLYNLEHGFVYFDRHFCEKKTDSLYLVSEFQQQFGIRDYELVLILPAALKIDHRKDILSLLKDISRYKTYEQYSSVNSAVDIEKAREEYCVSISECHTSQNSDPCFQDWAYKNHRAGCFPLSVMKINKLKKISILPRMVEDVKEKGAWQFSQYIRQCIYGLIGIPMDAQVKETLRKNNIAELEDQQVSPQSLPQGVLTIYDDCFQKRDVEVLSNVVLSVLKCYDMRDQSRFEDLESTWKLPIAATFYWHCKLDERPCRKRELTKSLVMSFLTCSAQGALTTDEELPLERVTWRTKSDHLSDLHAFAQWQCVYYDAMTLNQLCREPFPTTSPAQLFSGKVAMHYALVSRRGGSWLEEIVGRSSSEWRLIEKLLALVTH